MGGPPSPRAALLCLPPGSTLFAALPQPCWQSPSLLSCLPAQDCSVGTVIAPSGHPLLPLPRVHGVAPLVLGVWAPQHPGGRVPGDGAGSRTPLPTCVRKEACCALRGDGSYPGSDRCDNISLWEHSITLPVSNSLPGRPPPLGGPAPWARRLSCWGCRAQTLARVPGDPCSEAACPGSSEDDSYSWSSLYA